jgi:hypothetical protein
MAYSRHELFVLRNRIPIAGLIEKLGIPAKMSEGCFRFCCPVCRKCNTGVNPRTNLARCFGCETNYNTIDLVMLVKRLDFNRSIKFLKSIYNQQNKPAATSPSGNDAAAGMPEAIGHILTSMASAWKDGPHLPSKNTNSRPTVEMLRDRVEQLERQVYHLSEKIKAIEQSR